MPQGSWQEPDGIPVQEEWGTDLWMVRAETCGCGVIRLGFTYHGGVQSGTWAQERADTQRKTSQ